MADPKLKPVAPAGAPRRVLLNTGAAPTKRVTLLGANGRSIPSKSPSPTPEAHPAPESAPTPEPQVDEAALQAQQEYERQMEEYNRQMEEYNRQLAEYEAQLKAQEEAEAAARAEAEAAAAAQAAAEAAAAAAQQQEESAAIVDAPQPVSAPASPVAGPKLSVARPTAKTSAGPKLSVARPGTKPAGAPVLKPKAAGATPLRASRPAVGASTPLPPGTPPPPAPVTEEAAAEEYAEAAPEMSEAEAARHNELMEKLQYETSKTPFHKKPVFYIACGILLVLAIVGKFIVSSSEDAAAAVQAKRDAAAAVLNRAIEIVQKEINTLDDAKAQNVTIKCSKEDADLLLHIILNHDETDENGLCWGPDTVGTAKNACVLLGIGSELDAGICEQVFKTLAKNATKMHPELLDELLNRLTKTNIKKLNSKLNALAKPLNPKENADVLAVIWQYKERLATAKDVDKIIDFLKIDDLDSGLNNAARAYMLSLFKKMDNMEEKQAIGQRIYAVVKDKENKMNEQNIMRMLAFSCVPEALDYYKAKMEDKKNWQKYSYFFGSWQNDDIVSYLNQLRSTCNEEDEAEKKYITTIDNTIMKVLTQDRPRSIEDAKALLAAAYDDFHADTSNIQNLINHLDTNPDDAAAQGEYDKLQRLILQKTRVVQNLGNCKEYHDWIDAILNDIEAECNAVHGSLLHNKLANQITQTRNKIKENELKRANSDAKHKKRMELEE